MRLKEVFEAFLYYGKAVFFPFGDIEIIKFWAIKSNHLEMGNSLFIYLFIGIDKS